MVSILQICQWRHCSSFARHHHHTLFELLVRLAASMPGQEVVFAVVRFEDGDHVAVAFVWNDGTVCAALVLLHFILADVFQKADVL